MSRFLARHAESQPDSAAVCRASREPKRLELAKRFILDGLDSGKLKPIIAKTFSGLDQIVEAHRYLESNQQVGKIVVTV
jgi:NADPH:quinone reductase